MKVSYREESDHFALLMSLFGQQRVVACEVGPSRVFPNISSRIQCTNIVVFLVLGQYAALQRIFHCTPDIRKDSRSRRLQCRSEK